MSCVLNFLFNQFLTIVNYSWPAQLRESESRFVFADSLSPATEQCFYDFSFLLHFNKPANSLEQGTQERDFSIKLKSAKDHFAIIHFQIPSSKNKLNNSERKKYTIYRGIVRVVVRILITSDRAPCFHHVKSHVISRAQKIFCRLFGEYQVQQIDQWIDTSQNRARIN